MNHVLPACWILYRLSEKLTGHLSRWRCRLEEEFQKVYEVVLHRCNYAGCMDQPAEELMYWPGTQANLTYYQSGQH
jgi:hypothetical protein